MGTRAPAGGFCPLTSMPPPARSVFLVNRLVFSIDEKMPGVDKQGYRPSLLVSVEKEDPLGHSPL